MSIPRQQVSSALTRHKALDDFKYKLSFLLFMKHFEVFPVYGVNSNPGRFSLAKALVAAVLFSSPHANALTGNELLEKINGTNSQQIFAMGYISGTLDNAMEICVPDGVTNIQAVDVVRNYLVKMPHNRHLPAGMLVRISVVPSWLCEIKK